jgi:quercetin dioxygenase-like cupin family protein
LVKITPVLQADAIWDGKPIQYPTGKALVTGMMIKIVPGGETGWRLRTVPSFAVVLEGELEVKLEECGETADGRRCNC